MTSPVISPMSKLFTTVMSDESGATAIEYGLIAALIAVGIIAAARSLGTQVSSTFSNVATSMQNA